MLVSNFYVEYRGAIGRSSAYRSGYELEITNLSSRSIEFEVVARVTRYSFRFLGMPLTTEAVMGNLAKLVSGVQTNDQWNWFKHEWRYDADGFALHVRIPTAPGTSELFHMLPGWFQMDPMWFPRVAGHVELLVPAVRSTEQPYTWGPQTGEPVPVLLNPSTLEGHEGSGPDKTPSDARTTPPLATGNAYNEIEPETLPRLPKTSVRDLLNQIHHVGFVGSVGVAGGLLPQQRAQVLIDLLESIGEDEAEQEALNEALEAFGNPLRVSRPGRQRG